MILKLAWREIRNNRRFSVFFVLCLAVGFAGLVAVDSLKLSVRNALEQRAKSLLAADLSVGARRPLTTAEEETLSQLLPRDVERSQLFESYTMLTTGLATGSRSRLVELKAIEENYPFYGELQLRDQGVIRSTTRKALFDRPSIWVYPELLIELGLKHNDSVTIGSITFQIIDIIKSDSSGVGTGFNFAPPVYVAKRYFEESGLLGVGATAQYSNLYRLPSGTDVDGLSKRLNSAFIDPAVRVTTSKNASEQIGRLLGYLSDYLGLSGLVALFLMSLGQIFLYRNYLMRRFQDMAILKTLGLSASGVFLVYNCQVLMLGLLAIVPTILAAWLLLPLLEGPIRELAQIDISLTLHPQTVALVVILALTSQALLLFPLLYRVFHVRPKELLQPVEHLSDKIHPRTIIAYLPALLAYWSVSIWLAKSFRVGSLFFALFMGAMVALLVTAYIFLFVVEKFPLRSVAARLAIQNLRRSRLGTLATFVTIGLGILLTNLIPQIQSGLLTEVSAPAGLEPPSLFLFDIQPEQRIELEGFLSGEGLALTSLSPMIRARLVTVNDEPFEKRSRFTEVSTREEENENRFRNRGFNLTWRNHLTPSETIVSGEDFSTAASFTEPDLSRISIESRFADRLKLKLGDTLVFDIQGITVKGRIVNLRSVRWTSFQPNFFVQFEDGPLNDAPQTLLATLGALPQEQKLDIQTKLANKFPNISSVDLSRVVTRVTGVVEQWSIALNVMGLFCLFVGLIILFSVATHQITERRQEVNLMKVLGAEFSLIRRMFFTEFLLVSLLAAICGTLMSFALSYTVAVVVFESAWSIPWKQPLLIFVGLSVSVVVILSWTIRTVLKSKPKELLQST